MEEIAGNEIAGVGIAVELAGVVQQPVWAADCLELAHTFSTSKD